MDIIGLFKNKDNLEFNKNQLDIIDHIYGPGLVLATAGSGKTTIICTRIGNLITNYNTDPSRILTLSYSNASVNDIKLRFQKLLLGKIHMLELEKVKFSTIHSFAFSVVSSYYRMINKNIFLIEGQNYSKKKNLIRICYEEIVKREPTTKEIEYVMERISHVKNNSIDVNNFKTNIYGFKFIMEKYEQSKAQKNWLDYDDMLHLAENILIHNYDIRDRYRKKYDFIQVDEAQDISRVQYNIIKLLLTPLNNILLVGDDDQCIYSYRGSDPFLLKEYTNDFYNVKIYNLDKNYRSTKTIVNMSKNFISKNSNRFEKNIEFVNELQTPVNINKFKSEYDQNNYIIDQIEENYKDEFKDTAILYRDNISAIQLIDKLTRKNIPYYVKNGELNFFKSWIKNDIIAILLLADDFTYSEAFVQVYNKFDLFLKRQDLIKIINEQHKNESIFTTINRIWGFSKEQRNAINNFEDHLNRLKKLKSSNIIDYILQDMGYIKYLNKISGKNGYDKSTYARSIELLKYFLNKDTGVREFWYRIGTLQSSIIRSEDNKDENAIRLDTFHGSKGLEFKNVFLLELNEGVIPVEKNSNEIMQNTYDKIEEERRLMYVAITRAKQNLHLCSTNTPSVFVNEIEAIIN